MHFLVVEAREGEKRRYPLDDRLVTIGRDPGCDIRVDDPLIAPHHATLTREYVLRHEGLGQGLFHRGRAVDEKVLYRGEVVGVGASGGVRLSLRAADLGSESDELDALRRRVFELEGEKDELRARVADLERELERIRGSLSDRGARLRREAADRWLRELLGERAPTVDELERDGTSIEELDDKLLYLTNRLWSHASKMASISLMLATPGRDGVDSSSARQRGDEVFAGQVRDALRQRGDASLSSLDRLASSVWDRWVRANLVMYRRAVVDWATGFLARLSWVNIRRKAGVPRLLARLGLGHGSFVRAYRDELDEVSVDEVVDDIDAILEQNMHDIRSRSTS